MTKTKSIWSVLLIVLSLALALGAAYAASLLLAPPAMGGEGSPLTLPAEDALILPVSDDSHPDGVALINEEGVHITRVVGKTYKGYMALIDDPTRIFVGTPDIFSEGLGGLTVPEMTDKYGAVLGLNGGGYVDVDGVGTGGTPDGLIIQNGEVVWGGFGTPYDVLAFDKDGTLHVGMMTGDECLDAGVVEAVSFGPALIIDGVAQDFSNDTRNNVNPRTAVGQREDGTVVFLILEGRQVSTLGATLDTLTGLLLDAGCVTATNLDGGGSSTMEYKDHTFNICGSVYGPRNCVTAFLVRPFEEAAK